jgi:mRNA interferase MazF
MAIASRSEIWRVDLEPVLGHEQGRVRPALIVSNDISNHGPAELVTIVPITTQHRPMRSYLRIDPPAAGLKQVNYVICDQVRTISKRRLGKRYGSLAPATMAEVELRLKFLLDLR